AALADWEHRAVDYAEAIDLDWEVVNVILALIIGLGVFGAARVGPPAAWQALADLFRSAQAQTADTAARLFADVNPPAAHTSLGSARLPDLDQIGRPLPQGDEAIMWVTLSDPAPPPPGAPEASPAPRHYWRSRVYGEYTGAGWQPVEAGDPWPLPAEAPAGRYVLRQQYQIAAPVGDELFAVNAPITASAGLRVVSLGLTADSVVSGAAVDYEVTSWAAAVTGSALDQAGAAYPEALPAQYRQLPADLPPRVRDLAARIAGAAATPYTKALRVQDYLRANYPYQLDAPLPPAGADAVDFFLFDAPGGFCTYYASAMVVLLRAQGVPARVAAGFAMGEFDTARGAWRVPAGAAHAWVEVYFPAYGWVEFEPTPAQARPDYGALTAPEPEPPPRASVGAPAPDLRWGWVWGAGLLLAGLSAGWWYARRTRRGQAPAVRLYWQARAALADAHLSAPPSATPDEFLAACAPALQPRPALRAAVQQLTRLYTAMTYSPHAVSAAEVRAAAGLWRRAWRERWLVWWLSRWPRPPAPPTAPAKSGTDHRTPRR
ncbi:MAG: transglutaminase domain-containing protein, partial [Anaerolineales bacterium]|nr:transglutaminase domain-containing protein [Anaerolineales bacterium]